MSLSATNLLRQVRQLAARQAFDQWTDQQLLQRFTAQRDEAIFTLLVRRHGPMVLSVCRRILGHEQDAEDAFQATFLILARKAGSIRQTDVGGFLYRVAYHLATRARAKASKRKQREKQGGIPSVAAPQGEVTWPDVRQVVDEELQHLPEDLRCALVLCYLEGKTQEEAARLLGWSKGTLRRRLDKGRELLRSRLLARGLAPMAALTASLFAEKTVPAAVSAALADATVRTILASKVAPAVAALAEAGLEVVFLGKMKTATTLVLLLSVLGGAGVWISATPPAAVVPLAQPAAVQAKDKPPTAPSQRAAAKTVQIQGRVVDPDGKPKAGAKLLLLREDGNVQQLGVTAADGRFTVAVAKELKHRWLIAQTDGAGIDFFSLDQKKPGKPVELRLVKDQVIRGRVVNTEGKPVRGVRVAVQSVNVYPNNSLDSFSVAWKKRHFQKGIAGGEKGFWSEAGALLPTTTDADGRFTLHGVGAERLASLRLGGAGIADAELWIVNRDGFDPKPYNQASLDNIPKGYERLAYRIVLYGPNMSVVAEAEKPIRGVVKDADSGKGRAGVVVYLTRNNGDALVRPVVQAKTDAQGRYELHGVHKAKSYMLEVRGAAAAGYMPCQVRADDTAGYQAISADIRVKKGAILTGKMIDGATGKPITGGFVRTGVLVNNPFAKAYPEFNSSGLSDLDYTADDGTFRVATVPGAVLLMGLAYGRVPGGFAERVKYKPALADPKYPQYFTKIAAFTAYVNSAGGRSIVEGNFCKVLHIKPGADVVKQDIVLERASALAVSIQDSEGRPLPGAWVTGIGFEPGFNALRVEKDSCSAYHLETGKPRLMVFYQPDKKLAGTLTLKGDEKPPVAVKLRPAGAIKGRLLDADGKPLAGIAVEVGYRDREAEMVHRVIHKAKLVVSDANGTFTFDELIPERKFSVASLHRGKPLVEEGSTRQKPIVHEVKSGECRDLGALKLKPLAE